MSLFQKVSYFATPSETMQWLPANLYVLYNTLIMPYHSSQIVVLHFFFNSLRPIVKNLLTLPWINSLIFLVFRMEIQQGCSCPWSSMFYFTNGKLIFQICLQQIDIIFLFFFQTMYMAIVVYTPALALSQCKYQKQLCTAGCMNFHTIWSIFVS